VETDLILFKQLIAGEKKYYQFDKRYIQKNGNIIWGKLTVTTINDKKNKSKYIIRIVEDITKQKK
jgi:PAS domain S-box-containing protein